MIEIHRAASEYNELVMQMTEGETVLGTAAARLDFTEPSAEIIEIQHASYDLAKALLNAIDLMGIKTVYCSAQTLEPLLKRLGFSRQEARYLLKLDNYFTNTCEK